MFLKTNKEQLEFVLGRVSAAMARSGMSNVYYEMIRIRVEKDHVDFTVSDGLTAICVTVTCLGGEGAVCVHAGDFKNLVASCPDGDVAIEVDDNNALRVRAGQRRFVLGTQPADAYPQFEIESSAKHTKLKPEELVAAGHVSHCMARDQAHLDGVRFRWTGHRFEAAATNGNRAAFYEFNSRRAAAEFFVPEKCLHLANALVQDVELCATAAQLFLRAPGVRALFMLPHAPFLPVEQLPFPEAPAVTVSSEELQAALRAIAMASGHNVATLAVQDGKLLLSAKHPKNNREANDEIACTSEEKVPAWKGKYRSDWILEAVKECGETCGLHSRGKREFLGIRQGDFRVLISAIDLG